jgi:HTH-type transcriptional regulator / antitoxin HigA
MNEKRAFQADWVSPPGETIVDLLEEHGWTQSELATRTGFTRKHVNELVKGRVPMSTDAALRLERVLGGSVRFWLTRDAHYQEAVRRREVMRDLASETSWLSELPIADMIKNGWVTKRASTPEMVAECLTFFGVANVEAWRDKYEEPLVAYRASRKYAPKMGAVAAWIRAAEIEASGIASDDWDPSGFRSALEAAREITTEPDPNVFVPLVRRMCAPHGVAVVFLPAPKGCPVSGATQWLTPHKALLALSLRYRTNDHLWFTFFHEAGHLLLHGKRFRVVELDQRAEDAQEVAADRFARDMLIPPKCSADLPVLAQADAEAVKRFAERCGVAPGIVVGRMQHDRLLSFSHMNQLKVRYSWT